MSKYGAKVAIEHGKTLPSFDTGEEAEAYYLEQKEKHLYLLEKFAKRNNLFEMNFKPESLKILEEWYFYLYEHNKFSIFFKRSTFEKCMAYYFMEVVVKTDP